jgi:hypothetical protein
MTGCITMAPRGANVPITVLHEQGRRQTQEVASRVKPVDNGGAPAQGHPRPVAKNMGERDKLQFAGPARKVNLAESAGPGHATGPMHEVLSAGSADTRPLALLLTYLHSRSYWSQPHSGYTTLS